MKYEEDFPMKAGIYANAGDNDAEIAAKLGIAASAGRQSHDSLAGKEQTVR